METGCPIPRYGSLKRRDIARSVRVCAEHGRRWQEIAGTGAEHFGKGGPLFLPKEPAQPTPPHPIPQPHHTIPLGGGGGVPCILWGSVPCTLWGSIPCIIRSSGPCLLPRSVPCPLRGGVPCILGARAPCIVCPMGSAFPCVVCASAPAASRVSYGAASRASLRARAPRVHCRILASGHTARRGKENERKRKRKGKEKERKGKGTK